MRRILMMLAAFVGLAFTVPAQAATISIACGTLGAEFERCREGVEAWAKKSGHEVRLVQTPASATERLAVYQQLLAAKSADVDVFQIDIVWPGILGAHFVDLAQAIGAETIKQHFPSIVAANTINGQLVGVPWFTDAGILYYRKDLLEKHGRPVPQTWADVTETARLIQEQERDQQCQLLGHRLPGESLRGPDLQRARMGRQLRRRHHRGPGRQDHRQQPKSRGGPDAGRLLDRQSRAAGGDELHRGGGPRRFPIRQRTLHAQLAVCLASREFSRQPREGQSRHRRAAEGRP